ncbi:hypothetical protein CDO44_17540 [Pigmentiphaga sp. NML080357]|uniref:hypothetical protein n=1 Tax=Pigmentiphaga sp. NML080357 TaxID=2008675 RepID=UPI000B422282|nr:hypothetical protein [Pigmentiphaga sp. NML080357]OVZ57562.1 hypothetical protein CDO44_17540 [Pigmentiphaga sp. NML080357]
MHNETRCNLLSAAIALRSELQFHYNGATRIAHLHSIGSTTDGTLIVIAWQLDGRAGDPPGWRLYNAEKMNRLARTGRRFDPLPAPPYKLSGLIKAPVDAPALRDHAFDLPPLVTQQRKSRGRWLRSFDFAREH